MRPAHLAGVALLAALGTAARAQNAPLPAAIDSLALAPIRAGRVAGMSVIVVRNGDTLRLKGYGAADLELDVPTPDDAVYQLGSITKQFTAAAIFRLAQDSLLRLDDDITRYLPAFVTPGHRITIRHLLYHTSGIRDFNGLPEFSTDWAFRVLPRDSLVALLARQPLEFAPGSLMRYSNSGYFLLGLIVERASGEPYQDYVSREILRPAGMGASSFCAGSELIHGRVTGYEYLRGTLRRAQYLAAPWPFSEGGLCSTARDLVRWTRALHGAGARGGPLLQPATYRALMTPGRLDDHTELRYAGGLTLTQRDGRRVIGHAGSMAGFLADLRYYPDQDLSVAVLCNTFGPVSPGAIADSIVRLVLGPPAEGPPVEFEGDFAPFQGSYASPGMPGEPPFVVTADREGLSVRAGPGPAQRLQYVKDLTFSAGTGLYRFVQRGDHIRELRVDRVTSYYVLRKTEP